MTQTAATSANDPDAPQPGPLVQPVTVVVEVRAKPGQAAAATAEVAAAVRRWRQEPGCLSSVVLSDPADPARLLVLETFASREALQVHETAPGTHELLGRIGRHLAVPPTRTTWHPLPTA